MAGSLVLWGTPLPVGSGNVDIAGGTARLLAHNVCSVFDVFTVPNSFDPSHALGIFSAIINSMHGFHFESDPATTRTNFAQFGTEQNGVFFA